VEQAQLLKQTVELLERMGIAYMVVGSFASMAYGEPRLTQDIDIVIEPTPSELDQLCKAFDPDQFYVSREAAFDALRHRSQFNVIHPASGNKIDFMIAHTDQWGQEQLAHRRRIQISPGQDGIAASPEDVILSKMLYYQEGGSEKHLRDITGILKVSGDEVDRTYITKWAAELGVSDVWEAILKRLGLA
jgi:hypothetical protein